MGRPRCWRRRNRLTEFPLSCLQCSDGLRHLFLLAGKQVLITGELLYAELHNGNIADLSCACNSAEATAAAGGSIVDAGDNQLSDGAQVLTASLP
jgi:hypothetical protein